MSGDELGTGGDGSTSDDTSYRYNRRGRVEAKADPKGRWASSETSYNSAGRAQSKADGDSRWRSHETSYNSLGRAQSKADGNSRWRSDETSYNSLGRAQSKADNRGRWQANEASYNSLGRAKKGPGKGSWANSEASYNSSGRPKSQKPNSEDAESAKGAKRDRATKRTAVAGAAVGGAVAGRAKPKHFKNGKAQWGAGRVVRTAFGIRNGIKAAKALKNRQLGKAAWNAAKVVLGLKAWIWGGGIALTALAAIMLVAVVLAVATMVSMETPKQMALASFGAGAQDVEIDIPDAYLIAYQMSVMQEDIKKKCPNLPWQLVAAIGWRESNHGASTLPGVHSGSNSAGAAGPMQIGYVPGSAAGDGWHETYHRDGDKDGDEDVYDPADAAAGGAAHLCDDWLHWDSSHSLDTLWKAAFAYNQPWARQPYKSLPYVQDVMLKYQEYLAASAGSTGPWVVDGNAGPIPGHAPIPPPPPPYPGPVLDGAAGGCNMPDPSPQGGKCLTPQANYAVKQIQAAFGKRFKYFSCFNYRTPSPSGYVGEHPKGQACDIGPGRLEHYPTAPELADGWALAGWLRANAGALKVWYVIWQGRIWNIKDRTPDVGGWGHIYKGVDGRGTGITAMHYDHVHVSVLPFQ